MYCLAQKCVISAKEEPKLINGHVAEVLYHKQLRTNKQRRIRGRYQAAPQQHAHFKHKNEIKQKNLRKIGANVDYQMSKTVQLLVAPIQTLCFPWGKLPEPLP